MSNGDQTFRVAGLAMHKRVSPDFADTGNVTFRRDFWGTYIKV